MDDELDIIPEQNNEPFELVLSKLFSGGEVKIPLLFRFSDMAAGEHALFKQSWAQADTHTRQVIARHMADIAETNFEVEFSPVFHHMLFDADETVKLSALDGLWDTTNINVVRPIIDLMMSVAESAELRKSAAATLAHFVLLGEWGQISHYVRDRVVDALLEQYDNLENKDELRCAALEAIGASGNERIPEIITEAYDSGDRRFQTSAIFAMGSSADDRWINIIMEETESPYYEIRLEAARAAGEIGSDEAIASLAELVFDEEEEVSMMAVEALGKLGSERSKSVLQNIAGDRDLDHLADAANAALNQGDGFLDGIGLDFDDDDEEEGLLEEYGDDEYYSRLL
ncbi:MAG: HEAT repeat domain-containing protein [Candidatus Promineifilaceae bacterium]